jgi:predicted dehydrogenase
MRNRIKLGLWGSYGHQIHNSLDSYPELELCIVGDLDDTIESELLKKYPDVEVCNDYDEFLKFNGLEFVSLCTAMRVEQADLAMKALKAGIHVYAEKPSAITTEKLDELMAVAKDCGVIYHEMAGTVFDKPYWKIKEVVESGIIGEVVQVFAQKSYPNHGNRPTSELKDGGLIEQNGVHAFRFVEHVTGLKCRDVEAIETSLGETREGSDLKIACSMMGFLENGGIFTVIANYLNQSGFSSWGNEHVRIFGTKGWVESVDAGTKTRLIVGDKDYGELDTSEEAPNWLALIIKQIQTGEAVPFDLEKELHPTQMVVQAKEKARLFSINN